MEKVENKVEKKEYKVEMYGVQLRLSDEEVKKTSDLTSEDIDNLSRAQLCVLNSKKNRAGNRQYSYTVHLVFNQITITKYIDATEFKRICVSHGLLFDPTKDFEQKIPCWVRFVHGNSSTTGDKYFAYQLFPYGSKNNLIRRTMGCSFEFLHEKEIVDMGITSIERKDINGVLQWTKSFNELVLFRKTMDVVEDSDSLITDDYYN